MTDRELLELAAKAAGKKITWVSPSCGGGDVPYINVGSFTPTIWNPLFNADQGLRLAVSLGIEVSYHHDACKALAVAPGYSRGRGEHWVEGEPVRATLRAIVFAAAYIEQAKEPPCSSTN